MKIKTLFVGLLLLIILYNDCFSQNQKPKFITISGKFSEPDQSELFVTVNKANADVLQADNNSISSHTKRGTFEFKIPTDRIERLHITVTNTDSSVPERYLLNNLFGVSSFLLEAGDSVHIDFQPIIWDRRAYQTATARPSRLINHISDARITGRSANKLLVWQGLANIAERWRNKINPDSAPSDVNFSDAKSHVAIMAKHLKQTFELKDSLEKFISSLDKRFDKNFLNAVEIATLASLSDGAFMYFEYVDFANPEIVQIYNRFKKELLGPKAFKALDKYTHIYGSSSWIGKLGIFDQLPFDTVTTYAQFISLANRRTLTFKQLEKTFSNYPRLRDNIIVSQIASINSRFGWSSETDNLVNDFLNSPSSLKSYKDYLLAMKNKYSTNPKDNTAYINLILRDNDSNEVRLADFKGNAVLIDFMEYGCGPCVYMAKKLDEIEARYEGKNVKFVSLSVDKTFSRFREAIPAYTAKKSYPLYTNGQGMKHQIVTHFNVTAYPTLVLLDPDGKTVAFRAPDPRTDEGKTELVQLIDSIIGNKTVTKKSVEDIIKADDTMALAEALQYFDVDTCNRNYSFLSNAVRMNAEKCFMMLINRGANVNNSCNGYVPPLMHAAKYGRMKMVQILVEKGADIQYKYSGSYQPAFNKTPITYAEQFGHNDIAEYLNNAVKK